MGVRWGVDFLRKKGISLRRQLLESDSGCTSERELLELFHVIGQEGAHLGIDMGINGFCNSHREGECLRRK